jgi:hypothetical protein
MAKTVLEDLVTRLQEALELSHGDICKSLSDALCDMYPGQYCYICDVFGDDTSGDVVYHCGSDTYRAPYEIGLANGKRTTSIDTSQAINVLPRIVYDEEADEDDHYAGMGDDDDGDDETGNGDDDMGEAQLKRVVSDKFVERFPGSAKWDEKLWKFSERFISKDERTAADASDFAGKGKSFPILKPGDVKAAVHSMGRAGSANKSMGALKSSIIRIAKRKGWTKYLPKSWQSDSSESDDAATEAAEFDLTGDIIPLREGSVGQDGTAYLKLIAPGWGASGYYSEEVLARDGGKAFPTGTKNFWNHQTAAEESARPEGDLRDLASVLTEDAHYDKAGPAGAGLYAKAKVFEQFRQPVDDLAKHIGMSIRATGKAKEGKAAGKSGPIIEQLSRGISVDYVTTPGAGGKILQLFEAARRPAISLEESDMTSGMTKEEVQALIRESQAPLVTENKRLKDQISMLLAPNVLREALKDIRLPNPSKDRIIKRLADSVPLTEAGVIDQAKLKTMVEAEAVEEASFLESMGMGRIRDLGVSGGADPDPKAAKKQAKEVRREYKETLDGLAAIFVGEGADNKKKRKAFREGRAA